MIEILTANYAELNPEINAENFETENNNSLENSNTSADGTAINSDNNQPVDGNMNLFDNM